MTSELKPLDLNKLKAARDVIETANLTTEQYNAFEELFNAMSDALEHCIRSHNNTRAVSDVPELVRYVLGTPAFHEVSCMMERENGEYVRYDQATEMLAIKDKLIAQLIALDSDEVKRLESKLAAKEDECAKYRDYAAEKSNQVAGLQRDNAAKDARIAELENEIIKNGEDEDLGQWIYWRRRAKECAQRCSNQKAKIVGMTKKVTKLEADNKRLREALEPFADVADLDIGIDEDDRAVFWPISSERYSKAGRLRVGDLRRASAALGEVKT